MADEEKCAACKFFKPERMKQGLCRAKSPTPILYGMQANPMQQHLPPQPVIFAHFPVVGDDQWCGDWQSKGTT